MTAAVPSLTGYGYPAYGYGYGSGYYGGYRAAVKAVVRKSFMRFLPRTLSPRHITPLSAAISLTALWVSGVTGKMT
jgi:hypothetical protein